MFSLCFTGFSGDIFLPKFLDPRSHFLSFFILASCSLKNLIALIIFYVFFALFLNVACLHDGSLH